MTLLPRIFQRLSGVLGLAFLCGLVLTLSAQAAELEGTVVPLNASAPAALPAPEPVEPAPNASSSAMPMTPIDEPAPSLAPPEQHYAAMPQDEQALEALEERMEQVLSRHNRGSNIDLSQLVPITAIVFALGGPIFLLCFLITKRYQYRQWHQQSLNDNIDKFLAAGRDIPPELLRTDEAKATDKLGNRDKGVRNICIGTGVLIFLTILTGLDTGSIGFIWIALGVSQVLIWHLNQPKAGQPLAPQVEQQD